MSEIICNPKIGFRKFFESDAPYDAKEIVDKFSEYFGCSFQELEDIFINYSVLEVSEVKDYILNHSDRMLEVKRNNRAVLEDVIQNRMRDYYYFKEILAILSQKGQKYMMYLSYLASANGIHDAGLEEELEELGILHLGSVVVGVAMNQVFEALSQCALQFCDMLKKANSFETYHEQTIDSFAYCYGKDKLYPSSSLLLEKGMNWDKTSLMPKSLARRYFTNKRCS